MATIDYDEQRRSVVEPEEDSIEELQVHRASAQSPTVDVDPADATEGFDLPGGELSGDEPTMSVVVPIQADEFRCSRCFLVYHRGQRAPATTGQDVCRECA
jgi:hypothetical protein